MIIRDFRVDTLPRDLCIMTLDVGAWNPNVQQITQMENVIVAAVIKEDVVTESLNANVSLAH